MPVIARLHTEHFEFVALGKDRGEASVTMLDALRVHGKQYDCDDMWWLAYEDEVRYFDLKPGQASRDGSLIWPKQW